MKNSTKIVFAAAGGVGLAGLLLWWLADHRRGIAWAVSVVRARFPDVAQLSPAALQAWLGDTQSTPPQLIDARSEQEFAASHLPGAQRVDPGATASATLAALEPARRVVVYCSAGYRGSTLARRLQKAGHRNIWNLEGGIFAWANAGLPLEREGRPTHRVHPYFRVFSRLLKR